MPRVNRTEICASDAVLGFALLSNHLSSGLKEKRRRLKDISWFMRCLAEPIARRDDKDFVRHFRKRFRNEAGLPQARQDFRTTRREFRSAVEAS